MYNLPAPVQDPVSKSGGPPEKERKSEKRDLQRDLNDDEPFFLIENDSDNSFDGEVVEEIKEPVDQNFYIDSPDKIERIEKQERKLSEEISPDPVILEAKNSDKSKDSNSDSDEEDYDKYLDQLESQASLDVDSN